MALCAPAAALSCMTRCLSNRLVVSTIWRAQLTRSFSAAQTFQGRKLFTEKHEWVDVDGDIARIGISNFAQEALGDIVFVELPSVDQELAAGDAAAIIESVKAASDVYSPLSGSVTEVNEELSETPALINQSAEDKGWLFALKCSQKDEFKSLMDDSAYKKLLKDADNK